MSHHIARVAHPDPARAVADPRAVVEGPGYRFTVLTSRLIRMEHGEQFVDAPTRTVARRDFEVPEFTVAETDTSLDIWTEHLHLHHDKVSFSPAGLSVTMRAGVGWAHFTAWHHGDDPGPEGRGRNLGGTARTLDDADGPVPLEPGILARNGFAVLDDSGSVLLEDGWVRPRPAGGEDLYFFGYGRDVRAALRDYTRLTGPSPLVPRWALGNWWSRYHRYDEAEYLALMDRFAADGTPFSVAVIDMDWHVTDVDPAIGNGWTGYTWNRDLFPDPARFLAALHDRGLRVTLNVHPADGVRRHEEAYADVARDLGRDPATGLDVAFDIADREFADTYLRRLHHPHEEIGVDFWWVDWQSGTTSRIPGLDPLWLLNEVHHADSGRDGRRPLTFSRYAGPGSHRTPVGFSGDTIATWDSLAFQPGFTATAANLAYFWWSHDIGGHMGGTKDAELATRWLQFGVFSPINRLHSSSSRFSSKEPWRHGPRAEAVAARFLRLRHALVPYLYSAMWTSHTDAVGPVRPMYHDHPEAQEAYEVPGQYLFGPDLLVAPITAPGDRATGLGAATAWLPEGEWFDFFTGRRYRGGRHVVLHRPLEDMPVLARAGTVVVLAGDPGADVGALPEALEVRVFPGSGRAVLVEDDGAADVGPDERQLTTVRTERAGDRLTVTVEPVAGRRLLTRRRLTLDLVGVASGHLEGPGSVTPGGRGLLVDLGEVETAGGLEVVLTGVTDRREDPASAAFAILDRAEIDYHLKDRVMSRIDRLTVRGPGAVLGDLTGVDLPGNLRAALVEVLTAGA